MIHIREISQHNNDLLQQFLSKATEARKSFRYFESRDISILKKHVYTILALEEGDPVGYGHLDFEENIWLGICVADEAQGKGIGKLIMQKLVDAAREKKIGKMKLSVDKENKSAINLYQKYGFQVVDASNQSYVFMELNIH